MAAWLRWIWFVVWSCDDAESEGLAAPAANFGVTGFVLGLEVEADRCVHDRPEWLDVVAGHEFTGLAEPARHLDDGVAAWAFARLSECLAHGWHIEVVVICLTFASDDNAHGAQRDAETFCDLATTVSLLEETFDIANDGR